MTYLASREKLIPGLSLMNSAALDLAVSVNSPWWRQNDGKWPFCLPTIGVVLVRGHSCACIVARGSLSRVMPEQYLCRHCTHTLLSRGTLCGSLPQSCSHPQGTNWIWIWVLHPPGKSQVPPSQCNWCSFQWPCLGSTFWLCHLLGSKWEGDHTRGSKGCWKSPLDLRLNEA